MFCLYLGDHGNIKIWDKIQGRIFGLRELSQPQRQHNTTQPQHRSWVEHKNYFANPTPPQKLNFGLQEPHINIYGPQCDQQTGPQQKNYKTEKNKNKLRLKLCQAQV